MADYISWGRNAPYKQALPNIPYEMSDVGIGLPPPKPANRVVTRALEEIEFAAGDAGIDLARPASKLYHDAVSVRKVRIKAMKRRAARGYGLPRPTAGFAKLAERDAILARSAKAEATYAKKLAFGKTGFGRTARAGKWLGRNVGGRIGGGILTLFSKPAFGVGLVFAAAAAGAGAGLFGALAANRPPRRSKAGYATQTMGSGFPTFFAASGPLSPNNLSTSGLTTALYRTRHKQH